MPDTSDQGVGESSPDFAQSRRAAHGLAVAAALLQRLGFVAVAGRGTQGDEFSQRGPRVPFRDRDRPTDQEKVAAYDSFLAEFGTP